MCLLDRHVQLVSQLVQETGSAMGLLPDNQNCGLRMRRECRERLPRHPG